MSDKGNGNGQAGSSRRIYIIICFFLIIIVALVGVIAFLLGRNANKGGSDNGTDTSNNTNDREVVGSSRVVLDESSATDAMEEMRKEVEEGMFECNMTTTWTFEDGDSESLDAYVANSKNNYKPFYFDVVLDGTDEVIYTSPVLSVGSTLTNIKLDKHLDAGTYKAVCDYTLIKDEVSQEPVSAAGFVITIIVQN